MYNNCSVYNNYHKCTNILPDMYYTYMPEGHTEGIHVRQITLAHVITNM